MQEILIYVGLIIALGATVVLMFFGIKQWHMRQEAKITPLKYQEWLAQYKTKRFYILAAQILGIIIGIIGLSL